MVVINNQLDDWRQKHSSFVKYSKDIAKIGSGIAVRHFGLGVGGKVAQIIKNKCISLMSKVDIRESLADALIRHGYSEQEVHIYVDAICRLSKKLVTASDLLISDGNLTSITKDVAHLVNADTFIAECFGCSQDTVHKCIDITFMVANAPSSLHNVYEICSNPKKTLNNFYETCSKIFPKTETNVSLNHKKSFSKFHKIKQMFGGLF